MACVAAPGEWNNVSASGGFILYLLCGMAVQDYIKLLGTVILTSDMVIINPTPMLLAMELEASFNFCGFLVAMSIFLCIFLLLDLMRQELYRGKVPGPDQG